MNPSAQLYLRILESSRQTDPVNAIRDFRVLLESIFRQLTAADNRSFSNLFGRIEYIFDKMQVTELMQEQIHSLRILANKLSHEQLPLSEEKYLLSLKTICETVAYFYETPIPEELQEKYIKVKDRHFIRPKFKAKEEERIELIKPLVLQVFPMQETETGVKNFSIKCREETLGECYIQLWQQEDNDLSYLHSLLEPYHTLHILQCRKIAGKEDRYTSMKETQVILEPDLLLDISDLAECFQSKGVFPLTFLLKKLLPQTFNIAAFQGNMVNALLDEAVRTPNPEFIPAFKKTVAENVFQAAAYGKQKLNEIYTTIRNQHWTNVMQVADDNRHKPVRIEPTFFSARYGLQGRLDMMVEDDTDPYRKDIIELKSGKSPDYGLWKNNEMQVVGYNLLLRSTFGSRRTGSSAILYSAANGDPLRNVVSNPVVENKLLHLRNHAAAYLLQLASGNYSILDTIHPGVAIGLPNYAQADYQRFRDTYSQANPLAKTYYQHFLRFLIREFLNAKCGIYSATEREEEGDGFAALWLQEEEDKMKSFSILRMLQFTRFEEADSTVHFKIDAMQNHNFRPGDTVLLYPRTENGLQPLQQQIVKARLDSIQAKELLLSLNNRQLDASYFNRFSDWVLEHDIYESNYWQSARSLFSVLMAGSESKFSLLTGKATPASTDIKPLIENSLNANQREVLQKAIAAKDYFLVQGPPGTGKTSTFLTHLVTELQQKEGSMVIVAFTNRAVEEIANRLTAKKISYLRLGSRQSESEAMLRKMVEDGDIEAVSTHIKRHRIFLSTVATMAGRLESLKLLKPDLRTLVVDEASQLTEPQLVSLVMDFEKFILIGDQNQLPPVVAQDAGFCKVEDPLLKAIGLQDLRVSLFERLMQICKDRGWAHAWGMLTMHFRMHRDIADLINPWYGNQLVCGREEQEQSFAPEGKSGDDWHKVLSAGRAVFIPSPKEITSKYHRTEAERVVSLLHYLRQTYGERFTKDTVGVVTPWRTQIGLIRSLIGDDPVLQDLNIDTVERFQGSENDIIIVSLAVYHPAQLLMLNSPGRFGYSDEEGFKEIAVDRKLLVTLSRARKQVVFMGDEGVINANKYYVGIVGKFLHFNF